jgi:hypothetical protein
VDLISSPPKERDIEAKHANSTAGLVAQKANVSEYMAAQALTVGQYPEISVEVISGKKRLCDAVKEVPRKRPVVEIEAEPVTSLTRTKGKICGPSS